MTKSNPPPWHRPPRKPRRAAAHRDNPRGHKPLGDGRPLHLIFDADDTLWDSNIHFLEAEAHFVAELVAAKAGANEAVRAAIRRRELEIIKSHGYGRAPFVALMRMIAAELAPPGGRETLGAAVERIAAHFMERECELLPDVEPTLTDLAARHHLTLFTKGQPREQLRKLERSGLRRHFSHVEVPPEKDEAAYRRLVEAAALDRTRAFMIGNSPRSDINPALRAGLRAVFIPHPHTWELEHEEVDLNDERVTLISNFRILREIF
ncbi:MAG TPA: HAD family hydrolase [Candidatus Binataceae bacterium]|nr:HAD family hydrolase [Candidatus Binataceae bacterium]